MGVKDELRGNRQGRGNGAPKRAANYRSDSEFINLELDTKQTAAYRTWRQDAENVINLWSELVEEGYRVNSKYDDYGSCCAVFIIPPEGHVNGGYILTGRGGNPYRALSEAIFKHYEVLHSDWNNHVQNGPLERDADF